MSRPDREALSVLTDPIALQRLEGGMMLALSLLLFWKYSGAWLLYALLILAPDVFMLGYLRGPRVGAAIYNLGHTWLLPGLIGIVGLLAGPGADVRSRSSGSATSAWIGSWDMASSCQPGFSTRTWDGAAATADTLG